MTSAPGVDRRSRTTGGERGFTLIELLIVLAITGVVASMLALILYQLSTIPRWGGAQIAVDSDLRNAGLWLLRDGNASWRFTPGAPPVYGTFDITRTGDLTATATYRYDAGATTVWRDYQTAVESSTVGVARHVEDQADWVFAPGVDTITVQVTATSGEGDSRVSASQTYTVTLRAARD